MRGPVDLVRTWYTRHPEQYGVGAVLVLMCFLAVMGGLLAVTAP